MGDSGSPSRHPTTASASSVGLTRAGGDAVAGAAAMGGGPAAAGASTGRVAQAVDAPGISWASETAPGSRSGPHAARQISRQVSQISQLSQASQASRESRESRETRSGRPVSRTGQQTPGGQERQSTARNQSPDSNTFAGSASSSKTLQPSPASSTTPSRRRSFFSRFSLPFRAPTLSFADFYIRPAAPHRKYTAGDHVLGAVVLAVIKPLRITHLTVSLRGLVRVFKDPGAAATAALPADTAVDSSSTSSRLLGTKAYGSSSSYLGNGHALLFRDEIVLSGNGLLKPGNYEFEFDLIFPSEGLPSSIDFERGSICYVITATLTRPTTVAPVQSCDRKVYLVDPVDIGAVCKPRPRTISLEPISKRSKKRKMVVVTQPPPFANSATAASSVSNTPTAAGVPPGAMSTFSFASGAGSSDVHDSALSERGSARDSAHEPIQAEDHAEEADQYGARHPRSPAPTDLRSEDSVETGASGSSANRSGGGGAGAAVAMDALASAAGPGSGSGSGLGSRSGSGGSGSGSGSGAPGAATNHINSPAGSQAAASIAGNSAATTTGTSSTITNPGARLQIAQPASSASTATVSGTSDDRTITTTVELLKGGCLPGEVVNVKISVQHVKRIKSLHGVVVTLYRQGRIDSAPPELLFPSSGTSIAEEDEQQSTAQRTADENGLPSRNDAAGVLVGSSEADDAQGTLSRKQKKQKAKEEKEREKQLRERARENKKNGKGKEVSDGSRSSSSGRRSKGGKHEHYLPKSKTGLGGLSLMSAGTCSVFRKDLSQSFNPLIIDPHTLQSSVTASVRVPEDSFATIKGVPGEMISFKYQLEVIVDLGGKLASLLQSGVGGAGSNVVSGNPYDGKPILSASSTLWGNGSHMIDTAPLRRQKGVICVPFEVVVGTTDTSRQHGRVNTPAAAPDRPALPESQQQQPPPQAYPSTQPPDWYPEDRKDQRLIPQQPPYPSWPANGATASGSGSGRGSGPPAESSGAGGHAYYQQASQDPPNPYHQYQSQQPAGYDYYDERGAAARGPSHPSYTGALPPPSAQAPQYAPTDAMLAAERDPNLSEKERIRRAEQQLLPSQPGQPGINAPGGSGHGEGSSRNTSGTHDPSAPSAPPLEEVAAFSPLATVHEQPSAPPDFASLPTRSDPPSFSGSSAVEDKQELERRRLLAEASAPPEFPEDYQDSAAGHGRSRRSSRAEGSSRPSQPAGANDVSSFAASAPVLEEEDATHEQYLQQPQQQHQPPYASQPGFFNGNASGGYGASAPYIPAGEQGGQGADSPSAPPADLVPAAGDVAGPSAPSAGDVAAATDEDRYGENYAYGPDTTTGAAHGVGGAETAEPLPRYER